jgi:hypothetical protein
VEREVNGKFLETPKVFIRHSGESRNPVFLINWTPAFADVTALFGVSLTN